jgi:hypothetical protein
VGDEDIAARASGPVPAILHLRHNLKGDDANAQGIAYALADRLGGRVVSLDCSVRGNMLLPVVRMIVRSRKKNRLGMDIAAGLRWWPMIFQGERPTAEPLAAVVSTLGRGEGPAAYISSYWRAPAIHLGTPKRVTREELTAVVAHQGHEPNAGEIVLPISPTRVLRRAAGDAHRNLVLVLIGGDAEGVTYSAPFWGQLVAYSASFARGKGQKVMIVTSPRTGSAESAIEAHAKEQGLPPASVALYGQPTTGSYVELLHAAETVFVTAESVSMISDAIAAGAKVVAVYQGELPRSDRMRRFIAQQSTSRRIAVLDLSAPNPADDIRTLQPLEDCWSDVLWMHVKPFFASSK